MTPLATEGVRNADSMQKTRCQTPLSPSEINNLIEALHQGVTPATGCTEPIALAYAAARAKRALGSDAKQLDSLHIDARVSPNIMKNGMAVMVPGTGRPGLEIAAAVGALAGNPDAGLAVLADVSEDAAEKARHLVDSGAVELTVADVDDDLYAETVLHLDGHHARACIAGDHTNVFLVSRDDEALESKERPAAGHVPRRPHSSKASVWPRSTISLPPWILSASSSLPKPNASTAPWSMLDETAPTGLVKVPPYSDRSTAAWPQTTCAHA